VRRDIGVLAWVVVEINCQILKVAVLDLKSENNGTLILFWDRNGNVPKQAIGPNYS
jgi:hypothetical protein